MLFMDKESMQPKNIERRQYVRVKTNSIMKLQELSGAIDHKNAIPKNISRGGILFEYNKPFPLATVLDIEIKLPEIGKSIECYAKVVRLEEIIHEKVYDIGVSFISIPEKDIIDLIRFIDIKLRIYGEIV